MDEVGSGSQEGFNTPPTAINRATHLGPYKFQKGHAGLAGAGRPKVPWKLSKLLPNAIEAMGNAIADPKSKWHGQAVHDCIAWNIGNPGTAYSQEPEDLRALFNEALEAYGWEVVKKPPEGDGNDKDQLSDPDASIGGLRNGTNGG